LAERRLTPSELRFLRDAMNAGYKDANVRLREGEYQYSLVKTIAKFALEAFFPDVKDIVKRLYGEEKVNDIQFIRKIQTVLKKMEKNGIVRILPKNKPWELQRYSLSSFKFRDSDKNLVSLVTDQEIEQTQHLLSSLLNQEEVSKTNYVRLGALGFIAVASYVAVLWSLVRPVIDPIIFASALTISVVSSLMVGKKLSKE
jgi:hypothetical protein